MTNDELPTRLEEMVEALEVSADRCARQLTRRVELDAELKALLAELESLLPTDSDGFRVFDRLRRKTFWREADHHEYVTRGDCEQLTYWLGVLREILETFQPPLAGPSVKTQILIQAGDAYPAKRRIWALLKRAQTGLDIVDSYMDEEIFDYIDSVPAALTIRLLTHDKKPVFRTLYQALHSTRPNVEARQSLQFHDRFIVLDGREVWHLGASLNRIGVSTSMVSKVLDPEALARLLAQLTQDWADGQPL